MCCVGKRKKKKLLLNEGMRNGENFSLENSSLSRLFTLSRIYFCFPLIVKLLYEGKQTASCVIPFEKICFHVSNINVTECETKKFTIRLDLFTTIQSL